MSDTSKPEDPSKDRKSDRPSDKKPEPVWYRPEWITAIVGVISAFLTVPDVVGNYLAKEQDIKIAEQEVKAAQLANQQSKQSNEFQIIQNSLNQQGEERIFMLRYFAATLDDPEAKSWAQAEVGRFDKLIEARKQLDEQRLEIEKTRRELLRKEAEATNTQELRDSLFALQAELDAQRQAIAEQDIAVNALVTQAGIESSPPDKGSVQKPSEETVNSFLRNNDWGACLLPAVDHFSERRVMISALLSDDNLQDLYDLDSKFASNFGSEANIRAHLISEAQCPTIRDIDKHVGNINSDLKIKLKQDILRKNEPLVGQVFGANDPLLFIVDESGVVIDLSSQLNGNAEFSISMINTDPFDRTPQLLIAASSTSGLHPGTSLKDVLRHAKNGDTSLAIKYFVLDS